MPDASPSGSTPGSGSRSGQTFALERESSTRATAAAHPPVARAGELRHLTTARVRSWHFDLLAAERPGAPTVAKCYRLLRAILSTAVEDELIVKNPCVLKGAGVERSPERPVATVEDVYAVADAIEPRFRALVLLATFTGLRLGELRALRREGLDLGRCTVQVTEQVQDLTNGTLVVGEPKSDAGRRTVTFPQVLVLELPGWRPRGCS